MEVWCAVSSLTVSLLGFSLVEEIKYAWLTVALKRFKAATPPPSLQTQINKNHNNKGMDPWESHNL